MTAKSQGDAPPQARTRTATVSYPYHPLDLCLALADAVREIGNGRQDVDKSLLAAHLKVDEQAADFRQKIASAKTYGMIDGKATLQLTEAAKSYFFPTQDPEREKAQALLKFFASPGAFNALIDAHDGSKPPSQEIVANIFSQKYGVPGSWASRVAGWFFRAGVTAGAIQPDGFLRYKAKVQSLGGGVTMFAGVPVPPVPLPTLPSPLAREVREEAREDVSVWTHGKSIRVETPENLTEEMWEKLNRYIQAIKP
jgi:hypothetical protein